MNDKICVIFKSTPENWLKERTGLKMNTVRKIDNDERFTHLKNGCRTIMLVNNQTGDYFVRTLTDYTEYEGMVILSWNVTT